MVYILNYYWTILVQSGQDYFPLLFGYTFKNSFNGQVLLRKSISPLFEESSQLLSQSLVNVFEQCCHYCQHNSIVKSPNSGCVKNFILAVACRHLLGIFMLKSMVLILIFIAWVYPFFAWILPDASQTIFIAFYNPSYFGFHICLRFEIANLLLLLAFRNIHNLSRAFMSVCNPNSLNFCFTSSTFFILLFQLPKLTKLPAAHHNL